jgi:hypothetical protein
MKTNLKQIASKHGYSSQVTKGTWLGKPGVSTVIGKPGAIKLGGLRVVVDQITGQQTLVRLLVGSYQETKPLKRYVLPENPLPVHLAVIVDAACKDLTAAHEQLTRWLSNS